MHRPHATLPFVATLALLVGCNAYQQDRVLHLVRDQPNHDPRIRGHQWGSPRQTWVDGACFVAYAGPWGPIEPTSGTVATLQQGDRALKRLQAPMPLQPLGWWEWGRAPFQCGRDTWMAGIPAHPAWYRLCETLQPGGGMIGKKALHHPHGRLPHAEARLFKSRDLGPWHEVARFIPASPKGWIQTLLPLEDGTFLALAERLFADGALRSPLMRMHRGPDNRLVAGPLMSLDESGQAPAQDTGTLTPRGRPHILWHPGTQGLAQPSGAIWTPQGIILVGTSAIALLDPRQGQVLRVTEVGTSQDDIRACQPRPDGKLVMVIQQWGDWDSPIQRALFEHGEGNRSHEHLKGRMWAHLFAQRRPAFRGLRVNLTTGALRPQSLGFRAVLVDPSTGRMEPLELPPPPTRSTFPRLRVTPEGTPTFPERWNRLRAF